MSLQQQDWLQRGYVITEANGHLKKPVLKTKPTIREEKRKERLSLLTEISQENNDTSSQNFEQKLIYRREFTIIRDWKQLENSNN